MSQCLIVQQPRWWIWAPTLWWIHYHTISIPLSIYCTQNESFTIKCSPPECLKVGSVSSSLNHSTHWFLSLDVEKLHLQNILNIWIKHHVSTGFVAMTLGVLHLCGHLIYAVTYCAVRKYSDSFYSGGGLELRCSNISELIKRHVRHLSL